MSYSCGRSSASAGSRGRRSVPEFGVALAAAWVGLLLCLVLVPLVAHGQAKKDKDTVVGTIWAFKAVNGSKVQKGTFRISDKEVFKGSKKVGGLKPPTWKGTLTKEDGSKLDVTVDVKDR